MITIAYQDEAAESAEIELQRFADNRYTVLLTPDADLMTDVTHAAEYEPLETTGPRDVRIIEVVRGAGWYGTVRVVDLDENGEECGAPYVVVVDRVEVY